MEYNLLIYVAMDCITLLQLSFDPDLLSYFIHSRYLGEQILLRFSRVLTFGCGILFLQTDNTSLGRNHQIN